LSLIPYISELYEGINGSCSPKDLETMMQLTKWYPFWKSISEDFLL